MGRERYGVGSKDLVQYERYTEHSTRIVSYYPLVINDGFVVIARSY